MLLAIDMMDLAVDDASDDPWAAYPEEVMQSGWNPDVPRLKPGFRTGHDARPSAPADGHPRSQTHPRGRLGGIPKRVLSTAWVRHPDLKVSP